MPVSCLEANEHCICSSAVRACTRTGPYGGAGGGRHGHAGIVDLVPRLFLTLHFPFQHLLDFDRAPLAGTRPGPNVPLPDPACDLRPCSLRLGTVTLTTSAPDDR
jgi:hypothetical protein